MSNPLADYLSAVEARDAREQAHGEYINAYTKLADRTATRTAQPASAAEHTDTASPPSTKTGRPATPKGKGAAASGPVSSPSALAQIRAELAHTQHTRSELETQLAAMTAQLAALTASDGLQKQRIAHLEKAKANLERRSKDRVDELKGKGKFVEDIQDEMVALTLQLNMAEQEKQALKQENDELTKRWVHKMEEEAKRMNDHMGWEEQTGRRRRQGSGG